jgi:uncharacterized protein YkwD
MLRSAAILAALAMACLAASPAGARPSAAEAELIRAINAERTPRGLVPLRVDLRLERAARAKSSEMLRTGTFAHGDVRGRLVRFGARGPMYGENLAWGVGAYASARHIVRGWMGSPGHRANLLRPGWNRIGLGALRGNFLGYNGATVVTVDFAGR